MTHISTPAAIALGGFALLFLSMLVVHLANKRRPRDDFEGPWSNPHLWTPPAADKESESDRIDAFIRGGINYRAKCKRLREAKQGEAVPCLCCIGECWG